VLEEDWRDLQSCAPFEMGRPTASAYNKQFAVAMACLVTAETDNPNDTVARCGPYSIFALVKQVCPSIVRDTDSGPRDGLSEVELNKALQVRHPQYLQKPNALDMQCSR
jgi:hypothetical protein